MTDTTPTTGPSGPGGANLRALRDHNSGLLLDLVRDSGELSRAELAERSGLTAQAVSKIVARLIGDGVLAESGRAAPSVGKPRTLLRLVPEARLALGAHLDRDELRLVLVDLAGRIVRSRRVRLRTPPRPATAIARIAGEAHDLVSAGGVSTDRVLGLGVGAPGPLDHRAGVVSGATNLPGWHEVPLRDRLAEATGFPVAVDKDTNAAVVAECWRRGERFRDAVLVYLGTGVGAGLVLDGRVHRGSRTNAGEFGHTTLVAGGPRCACGRRGCVEAVCGPGAVVARLARLRGSDPVPQAEVLRRFAEACAAARNGDRVAGAELVRAARLFGVAVVDLVNLLDVDQVVLGGRAVGPAGEPLLAGLRRALAGQARPVGRAPVEVSVSDLGEDLVAAGAAMLVLAGLSGRRLGAALAG
ncbi:ROK family transcriptional regulator [Gandjariella thermophila]|uniref:Transcriptional regulator n=1 Tax=Gandjariella thermophila TaxID=1931992 RepID=A0A4D4JB66_9PSEU|nr:ROK family transcriptional regulator [Gandjariella thermophila]GDY32250.1 transcriptional regulator [Gandjariella thermophila]